MTPDPATREAGIVPGELLPAENMALTVASAKIPAPHTQGETAVMDSPVAVSEVSAAAHLFKPDDWARVLDAGEVVDPFCWDDPDRSARQGKHLWRRPLP